MRKFIVVYMWNGIVSDVQAFDDEEEAVRALDNVFIHENPNAVDGSAIWILEDDNSVEILKMKRR